MFLCALDLQIKRVLLIAELDLFLEKLPTSNPKFFNQTAASALLLKKALSENDFVQVEKLKISEKGELGEIYKKALRIGEYMGNNVRWLRV